jgi:hypothetical protein
MKFIRSLLLVVASLCWTISCAHDTERDVVFECRPNDGSIKAIYWIETTGLGAVGTAYHWVSLIPIDASPRDALRAADPSGTIARLRGASDIRLVWLDSTTLRIEYPNTATFFRMTHGSRWLDVNTQNIHVDSRPLPLSEMSFPTDSNRCVVSPTRPSQTTLSSLSSR